MITGAALHRFRARVDAALADFVPARVIMFGVEVLGSCPGGRTQTEYLAGGESLNLRFPFRLPKADLPRAPRVGDSLDWIIDESTTVPLEVTEVSTRPREAVYGFAAKKRRVSAGAECQ